MNELPRPLEQMKMEARRDDWHLTFVGSDIRQLIGTIERRDTALEVLEEGYKAMQTRAEAAEAVVTKLLSAWARANEYGPVDDGSPSSRAAKDTLDMFRGAAEAARKEHGDG